jgi:hypothetical protein
VHHQEHECRGEQRDGGCRHGAGERGGSLIVDNFQSWFQSGTGSTVYSLLDNQMWGNTTSFGTKTALAGQ